MAIFDAVSFTSAGGHPVNEDCVLIARSNGRFAAIVADGLGGHGGGDVASAAAVAAIEGSLPSSGIANEAALTTCLDAANEAVLAKQNTSISMKSTVVILAVDIGKASFAHVGDTRGYFFSSGKLACQTMDHSVSQMAVLRGEITLGQIRFHEARNKLMRALGSDENAHGEITPLDPPQIGDAFLLCTDGFWEYVTEQEMEVDLLKSRDSDAWMSYMLTRIGGRVKKGHDNLSAIAVMMLDN